MLSLLLITGSVFVAALLEAFEAYMIVVAAGDEIGMRPAIAAAGLSTLTLVGLTAAFGSLILALPAVQIAAGSVLFVFGARWLVKSTLKLAGRWPSHHDEAPSKLTRWGGMLVAFKGVFAEGLEVLILVGALAGGHEVPALIGVISAVAVVLVAGYSLRHVATGVPKVYLKLVVGCMMMAFGTYFACEGLGVTLPGRNAAMIGLAALFLSIGALATRALRVPQEVT